MDASWSMVPVILPVVGSNERPLGRALTERVSGTPLGSVKWLATSMAGIGWPSLTVAGGMAVAVGGTSPTAILKVSGVEAPLSSVAVTVIV